MKKRIIKIFVIFAFGILFLLGLTQSVFSDYVSNLREQRANLQSQLDASNAQIEIIQSDVSELVNQITELNEQITSQEIEIELLQQQKEDLEKTIVETEENLEIATEEFEKQKKQLEERLVASYKAGETTYLDVLLQSSSLSEFISNYYMISELVSADEKMLERISEQKEQLEFAKLELKRQKKELNTTVEESENKAVSLENMRVISNSYIAQLSAEEAEYTNSIVEMQTEIKKVEAEILTAARMNIGYDYVGGEMAWPVPGYTLITSPYGMRTHPITGVYKLHTGTDISAPMGTDFIAANDGVVAKAEYNYAYGNMVMINHGGGVSTLYAHGSQILVEVGQSVTRGEPVLKVGSTGYSTGPHAHFEVRINGQYTDPMPYITK
ncbi:MAG: peptidoglycan DD-metalloendopeptidase family protein [Clostridia bacterium]|jgi:murein DD-endopeptidase MepM/ murein hydrolase activator NlpD|nr:peptidoglycan DD-metalloendopeptidase family protein [Clostridia bacterium]